MRKLCPVCGKPVPCRCKPRPRASRSRRTPEQEAVRKAQNPWRSRYRSRAYKEACQVALSRTGGRCAVSGAIIADRVGGRWKLRKCGGIHHRVPLSQGGTDEPSNLVPLHVSVHNRIDAELRRRRARDE